MDKKITNKILSGFLKFLIAVSLGFIWVCAVIFFAVLPTFWESESIVLSFFLMCIPLISPLLLAIYFNKEKRQDWLKEGKDFIVGMWYFIILIGILLGVLIVISLFFLAISTIFYWLVGLGTATLLVLILLVLILKK